MCRRGYDCYNNEDLGASYWPTVQDGYPEVMRLLAIISTAKGGKTPVADASQAVSEGPHMVIWGSLIDCKAKGGFSCTIL